MHISIRNIRCTLLPEKALLLNNSLILADTHFGKSASFRARGVPIPEGDTAQDTQRILGLLATHHPERLVIAGDFLHALEGKTPEVLASLSSLFASLPCETHLVLGNHDLRAGPLPRDWPVQIHNSLDLHNVTIVHDPTRAPAGRFSLCGHLHPVARVRDGRNTSFRTPCFWLRESSLILPSFGTFTGGAIVRSAPGDRIFVPLPGRVVEVPPAAL
jgi:DNA ligase-associated metallophosphoesterase